jgi:hypothetical protein
MAERLYLGVPRCSSAAAPISSWHLVARGYRRRAYRAQLLFACHETRLLLAGFAKGEPGPSAVVRSPALRYAGLGSLPLTPRHILFPDRHSAPLGFLGCPGQHQFLGRLQLPVPFPTRFQEGSGAAARGVERSETTRATTGDGPNAATIQDRADSPGATISFLRCKAPGPDMCPGETAATDAQWGDRAVERQYRDRMGLRWLECVCSRARSTGGLDGADRKRGRWPALTGPCPRPAHTRPVHITRSCTRNGSEKIERFTKKAHCKKLGSPDHCYRLDIVLMLKALCEASVGAPVLPGGLSGRSISTYGRTYEVSLKMGIRLTLDRTI